MSHAGVREGDLVAGKYRVERVLGEGGMGLVLKATHVELEQAVAIKLLREEVRDKPAVVERFGREAKALARLTSEHVTHVVDVAKLDDGSPYIVMEYLDGEDLAVVVAREGALPTELAIGYVLEACEAIAEAHSVRVVHRDLKPANLFLARRPGEKKPIVKVLDFGISKVLDDAVSLTKTASGLGSALYMAPEQMRNAKNCDERADVWAIGVILYELLSGHVPFGGESVHQVVANVLDQNRPKLSALVPSVPAAIEALVDECLVLDPEKRVGSVLAIVERIAPFGPRGAADSLDRVRRFSGEPSPPSLARPPLVTRSADTSPTPSQRLELGSAKTEEHAITFPQAAPDPAPTGKRPGLAWVAGIGVVALVVAGVALARNGTGTTPEAPAASSPVASAPSPTPSAPIAITAEPKAPPLAAEPTATPHPSEKPLAKKPEKGVPPAVVASAPPASPSAPPAPSAPVVVAPPKPSTGGIVPISTMGLK